MFVHSQSFALYMGISILNYILYFYIYCKRKVITAMNCVLGGMCVEG